MCMNVCAMLFTNQLKKQRVPIPEYAVLLTACQRRQLQCTGDHLQGAGCLCGVQLCLLHLPGQNLRLRQPENQLEKTRSQGPGAPLRAFQSVWKMGLKDKFRVGALVKTEVGVPVHIPAAHLQLPVAVHGKAADEEPSTWAPAFM